MQITRRNICPWPKDLPVASFFIYSLRMGGPAFCFLVFICALGRHLVICCQRLLLQITNSSNDNNNTNIQRSQSGRPRQRHIILLAFCQPACHIRCSTSWQRNKGAHLWRADAFALEWEIRIHVSFARTSRLTWLTFGPTTGATATETTTMMTPERKIFNCRAIFQLLHFFCSQQQQPRLASAPLWMTAWLPS